jgi:hypothetical protein
MFSQLQFRFCCLSLVAHVYHDIQNAPSHLDFPPTISISSRAKCLGTEAKILITHISPINPSSRINHSFRHRSFIVGGIIAPVGDLRPAQPGTPLYWSLPEYLTEYIESGVDQLTFGSHGLILQSRQQAECHESSVMTHACTFQHSSPLSSSLPFPFPSNFV